MGGFIGDVASGLGTGLEETGKFLEQFDPATERKQLQLAKQQQKQLLQQQFAQDLSGAAGLGESPFVETLAKHKPTQQVQLLKARSDKQFRQQKQKAQEIIAPFAKNLKGNDLLKFKAFTAAGQFGKAMDLVPAETVLPEDEIYREVIEGKTPGDLISVEDRLVGKYGKAKGQSILSSFKKKYSTPGLVDKAAQFVTEMQQTLGLAPSLKVPSDATLAPPPPSKQVKVKNPNTGQEQLIPAKNLKKALDRGWIEVK